MGCDTDVEDDVELGEAVFQSLPNGSELVSNALGWYVRSRMTSHAEAVRDKLGHRHDVTSTQVTLCLGVHQYRYWRAPLEIR